MARCKRETLAGLQCKRAAKEGDLCGPHSAAAASQSSHLKKERKPRAGSAAARALETEENKEKFLVGFGQIATVTGAAEHAGVSRRVHYQWLEADPDYTAAFAEAQLEANDRLESEARRRAVSGVEEPVWYQGEIVGTVRKHSDTLLIFLMKGANPEKYRDRHELTGAGGGPIQTSSIDLEALSIDTLRRIKKEMTVAKRARAAR